MIINGRGYICKKCKRDLMSDDITYYGSDGTAIKTNCCDARVGKPNWWDKLWRK